MSHYAREMSVFTHPRQILNGWEFARDWNQINRLKCFLYLSSPFLHWAKCDCKAERGMDE